MLFSCFNCYLSRVLYLTINYITEAPLNYSCYLYEGSFDLGKQLENKNGFRFAMGGSQSSYNLKKVKVVNRNQVPEKITFFFFL